MQLLAALILGLMPVSGYSSLYVYSGPVSGFIDAELTPVGFGEGGIGSSFGTLTETLNYDPVTGTLEEVGSVTISPSSGTFNIVGLIYNPGLDGSATLTIGNNGIISFDHTSVYTGGGNQGWLLNVPVSGSGIYNGQAFAGSWNLILPVNTFINAVSSTSLTFSERNLYGAVPGQEVIPGTDLRTGNDDGTYYCSWQLDSAEAMTVVPEPQNYGLLMALPALVMSCLVSRRQGGVSTHPIE